MHSLQSRWDVRWVRFLPLPPHQRRRHAASPPGAFTCDARFITIAGSPKDKLPRRPGPSCRSPRATSAKGVRGHPANMRFGSRDSANRFYPDGEGKLRMFSSKVPKLHPRKGGPPRKLVLAPGLRLLRPHLRHQPGLAHRGHAEQRHRLARRRHLRLRGLSISFALVTDAAVSGLSVASVTGRASGSTSATLTLEAIGCILQRCPAIPAVSHRCPAGARRTPVRPLVVRRGLSDESTTGRATVDGRTHPLGRRASDGANRVQQCWWRPYGPRHRQVESPRCPHHSGQETER